MTIPPQLKQPLPGALPSLTGLTIDRLGATTTVAKRGKVGYVESTGSSHGKYSFGATFTFPGTSQGNLSNVATVRAA